MNNDSYEQFWENELISGLGYGRRNGNGRGSGHEEYSLCNGDGWGNGYENYDDDFGYSGFGDGDGEGNGVFTGASFGNRPASFSRASPIMFW